MPKAPIKKVRYFLGNGLRLVTSPWRQFSISPNYATSIFGCSFSKNGWHHLTNTLSEYDRNPNIPVEKTVLYQYLKNFCIESISTLAGVKNEKPLPIFIYPWGTFNDGSIETNKDSRLSRFCGPSSDKFIQEEFYRTINLYIKIRNVGYQPTTFPNSHIGGTWLVTKENERRFVIMQGNHRMAILSHLGHQKISVRLIPSALNYVYETQLKKWLNLRCLIIQLALVMKCKTRGLK